MTEQFDLIHNTEWNTLIILDACRHDYFKKVNRIPGKLRKVRSKAHHTWEWLQSNFPDEYPWTYFSAHPYVGNKVRLTQPWNGPNHFERVIPVWLFGWNDKWGTVHPNMVSETVKNIPYEKAIIHYIQPHGPWIGKTKWLNPWTLQQWGYKMVMGDWIAVTEKPDPRFFRQCYKDNLRLVLGSVEKYMKHFKPPVVITADHGEMLGEKGVYLHGAIEKGKEHLGYPEWAKDFLKNVPWFTVDYSGYE